ncbi:DUF1330 domain-containing protein [Paeniroseomonas aquatica]|uniref:DUF1330 domain-containing protein n=1 Tax=Paeniroseomonas aquatica TaxID=373043 RepID=A0ABT8A229_9PROT|nr:DUF1330 domain-containing protein [Paeniroseomonas aquatica]MDN3563594.1 DUF1330 domain-containing protein [Paeniroseomonas aquatica]
MPETGEAPVPGPGQILVEVEAAGVNFLDVMQRKGHGRTPPFVPGLEGVGRVAAVGEGTAGAPAIGTRVAWIVAPGSYAERVIVPAERAIPVPGDLAPGEAMLFQALTAQYLAAEYRDVRPGDRVLVQAAAGGVGQILVQMLKRRGAWVIGTVSTEEKAGGASDAGADAVINYGRDGDFLPALRKLTDGRGVDLAFDSVGTTTLANTIKGLARGGTAVSYGSTSGPPPAVSPMELTSPCARVAGGSVFSYVADAAELRRRAVKVLDGIRAGWLRLPLARSFALDHAAQAHRAPRSHRPRSPSRGKGPIVTTRRSIVPSAAIAAALLAGVGAAPAAAQLATVPKAYYVAEFEPTDLAGLQPYSAGVASTFEPFGGRFAVRGGAVASLEGTPVRGRMIVIEFDSLERARAWYDSPGYTALRPIRQRSGLSRTYIVEGIAPGTAGTPPAR